MGALLKHCPRIVVTLLPLIFALLHAAGAVRLGVLERLDNIIYDSRLRATMPRTLDDRVVIVDIDEVSLRAEGRWPWPRAKLAQLVRRLFDDYQVRLVGFDIVFAELNSLDNAVMGQGYEYPSAVYDKVKYTTGCGATDDDTSDPM